MPNSIRPFLSVLLSALLVAPASFAFQSPLSDEAVREAYFLGQHRDESMARFLDKYTRYLREPDKGPYISSVTFLTPFARLVQLSSQRINYSAPQAAKEHVADDEAVAINIQILLTNSYPAMTAHRTGPRSDSPIGFTLRPSDFWRDFDVQVFVDDKALVPAHSSGEPTYRCDGDGGCVLIGATLHLELPAKLFTSDSATIQIDPPEGDQVVVDLDLTTLR